MDWHWDCGQELLVIYVCQRELLCLSGPQWVSVGYKELRMTCKCIALVSSMLRQKHTNTHTHLYDIRVRAYCFTFLRMLCVEGFILWHLLHLVPVLVAQNCTPAYLYVTKSYAKYLLEYIRLLIQTTVKDCMWNTHEIWLSIGRQVKLFAVFLFVLFVQISLKNLCGILILHVTVFE